MVIIGAYEYNKKDFLGKGGYGTVYVGRNIQTGIQTAIKVINNYYLNQNQRREIENLQDLDCINIVRLLDHKAVNGQVFLIMELCDNDLEHRIKDIGRDITEPEIRNFIRQTANGLRYIHNNGIVHRDIKPPNILIKRSGRKIVYKISDFGISKMVEGSQKMTYINSVCYRAPEFKSGECCSFNVDIYSLGITVCYMLSQDIEDLEYREYCSDNLAHLISKMVQKNRKKRYDADGVLDHDFITNY